MSEKVFFGNRSVSTLTPGKVYDVKASDSKDKVLVTNDSGLETEYDSDLFGELHKSFVVVVQGGIAEVEYIPDGCEFSIIDYDVND